MFAQLNAIVSGDPPTLPDGLYSDDLKDFLSKWLVTIFYSLTPVLMPMFEAYRRTQSPEQTIPN
jgi:hypothetical protein